MPYTYALCCVTYSSSLKGKGEEDVSLTHDSKFSHRTYFGKGEKKKKSDSMTLLSLALKRPSVFLLACMNFHHHPEQIMPRLAHCSYKVEQSQPAQLYHSMFPDSQETPRLMNKATSDV